MCSGQGPAKASSAHLYEGAGAHHVLLCNNTWLLGAALKHAVHICRELLWRDGLEAGLHPRRQLVLQPREVQALHFACCTHMSVSHVDLIVS